jgi:zinc-ribbon domain
VRPEALEVGLAVVVIGLAWLTIRWLDRGGAFAMPPGAVPAVTSEESTPSFAIGEAAPRYCTSCGAERRDADAFCARCGRPFRAAVAAAQTVAQVPPPSPQWQPPARTGDSGLRKILKLGLVIWTLGFPVVSCSPLLATGAATPGAAAVGGLTALLISSALLVPWLIGIVILGVLVAVTR